MNDDVKKMTNEEAIWTLENGAWWDSLPDDISDADKNPLISAIELAVDALKGHTGEPLTIEQLRGMDGQPVWLSVAGGVWGIVCASDGCVVVRPSQEIDIVVLDGLAYRYPPADVAPVVHGTWTDIGMDYKKCSKCGEAYNDIFCNPLNYCPNCGAKCIMHPSIPHGSATESEV